MITSARYGTAAAAEQFARKAAAYVPLRGRVHVFGSGEQHFVMPGADDERLRRTAAGLELAMHDALAELERQQRRCLVIVAEAGAGKTTFLQALCAEAMQGGGSVAGRPLLGAGSQRRARSFVTGEEDDTGDDDDDVAHGQDPWRGYVLLDGLAPEAARHGTVRALEAMMAAMPEARFVVAVRPSHLSSERLDDRFLEVRLCALNPTECQQLVERRFAMLCAGDQADALAGAMKKRLLEARLRPAGAFLTRNPLVLSALCRLYHREGTLPDEATGWLEACSLMADEVRDLPSSVDELLRCLGELGVREEASVREEAAESADPLRRGDAIRTQGGGTIRTERGGVDLLPVRGGTFQMGSQSGEQGRWDDEGPVHEVEVPDFYLAPYAVTNRQYGIYLAERPGTEPPPYWGDPAFARSDHPVVGVAWEEARRFAAWVGCRLPTEAEWEYACRAGTSDPRYGDLEQTCWYRGNSGAALHPVGRKEPNAWGLYDMLGNVWEWVEDDFHPGYVGAPYDGRAWCGRPRRTHHVLRGGSWADAPHVLRAATRLNDHPGPRIANVGFRLARSASP